MSNGCNQCSGYSRCIDAAASNNIVIKCIYFGQLKESFWKMVDQFNELGLQNTFKLE